MGHDAGRARLTAKGDSEQALKLNRLMVYVVLILLMVFMLLRAFVSIWQQAEQQLAFETRNIWVNQLSMLRGRWISDAKPNNISLIFQQDIKVLQFNPLGWPMVSNPSDCAKLWQIVLGRNDVEFNNLLAHVDFAPSHNSCQYRFSDAWVFHYDAGNGRVWWQDDGRVDF